MGFNCVKNDADRMALTHLHWRTYKVLRLMHSYVDELGICFPGVRALAEQTGFSKDTISKHVNILIACRLVAVIREPERDPLTRRYMPRVYIISPHYNQVHGDHWQTATEYWKTAGRNSLPIYNEETVGFGEHEYTFGSLEENAKACPSSIEGHNNNNNPQYQPSDQQSEIQPETTTTTTGSSEDGGKLGQGRNSNPPNQRDRTEEPSSAETPPVRSHSPEPSRQTDKPPRPQSSAKPAQQGAVHPEGPKHSSASYTKIPAVKEELEPEGEALAKRIRDEVKLPLKQARGAISMFGSSACEYVLTWDFVKGADNPGGAFRYALDRVGVQDAEDIPKPKRGKYDWIFEESYEDFVQR